MIITMTANPSHDRTVVLTEPLQHGAVQRAAAVTSQAGGKGVNISRASVTAGVPTLAVLPAHKDDPFVHELMAAGLLGTTIPEPRHVDPTLVDVHPLTFAPTPGS